MGAVDAVRRIHTFIMEKIREKPDPNPKLEETNKNFERHRQVCNEVIYRPINMVWYHFIINIYLAKEIPLVGIMDHKISCFENKEGVQIF